MALEIAEETLHTVRLLSSRAASLQAQAASLPAPLAAAYRRRAQELELEAFVLQQRIEDRQPVAAAR